MRVCLLSFIIFIQCGLFAAVGYRGAILHFIDNPTKVEVSNSYQYYEDGLLVVDEGKVVCVGDAAEILSTMELEEVKLYPDNLIVPGFIDTHTHYVQTDMIASYGEQLLEWLNKYTFPNEKRFLDKDYADRVAERFLSELLRHGTTTALVFGAKSVQSVNALCEKAQKLNICLIAGQASGDRNLPEHLICSLEEDDQKCRELISRWHKKGRLLYAVTPRFAPTSTPEHLSMIQKLLDEYPDVYLHTHLSENLAEVEWVKRLFPWSKNYLHVYDAYGLVRERSLFAHSIHLSDEEFDCLSKRGASISFCPSSNLFLGSGLFNWEKAKQYGIKVGIGTDVGAGTSFSVPHTLGEGYKVAQLQNQKINPFEAFYLATLGGAKALCLDHLIGNFEVGKEADFVILNLKATPLLAFRMENTTELLDKLFLLMILGDDRIVKETYVYGQMQYHS